MWRCGSRNDTRPSPALTRPRSGSSQLGASAPFTPPAEPHRGFEAGWTPGMDDHAPCCRMRVMGPRAGVAPMRSSWRAWAWRSPRERAVSVEAHKPCPHRAYGAPTGRRRSPAPAPVAVGRSWVCRAASGTARPRAAVIPRRGVRRRPVRRLERKTAGPCGPAGRDAKGVEGVSAWSASGSSRGPSAFSDLAAAGSS